MRTRDKRTVLVPIFGGDITEEALAAARSLLGEADCQLVLLHVAPETTDAARSRSQVEPRWHRLASAAAPDHTFVDAVIGDPVDEVLSEAQRFDSDAIVLGLPASSSPADAWIDRTIEQLVRAAPRRVRLAASRERPRRATHPATPHTNRALSPTWRSHAARAPIPTAAPVATRGRNSAH
jgi:hypothetical protein